MVSTATRRCPSYCTELTLRSPFTDRARLLAQVAAALGTLATGRTNIGQTHPHVVATLANTGRLIDLLAKRRPGHDNCPEQHRCQHPNRNLHQKTSISFLSPNIWTITPKKGLSQLFSARDHPLIKHVQFFDTPRLPMPLEVQRTENGELLSVVNPFTGVVTYLTDIHLKRSGFKKHHPPPSAEATAALARTLSTCPFCPGNEHLTTAEVWRFPSAPDPWSLRAFYNLFPRLPVHCTAGKNESYVLVDTPEHYQANATSPVDLAYSALLPEQDFRRLLAAAVDIARLSFQNPAVSSVVIRKNQGYESGASQPHPHTQIIGSDRVFQPILREKEVLASAPALWQDILDLVRAEGFLIEENDGCFLYFCPFGTFPRSYEIVDTRSFGRLDEIDTSRLDLFADLLRKALVILGDIPLDYEIHADSGLPLHAHINARHFAYSNIAGTLNLPTGLARFS